MRGTRRALRFPRVSKLLAVSAAATLALLSVPAVSHAVSRTVEIRDNKFEPREVRVDPGDTVVWVNRGARVHDVTSDDGSFRSEDLETGDRYSHTFSEEGYYYYHCSFHGTKRRGMSGVVIVGDLPPPPKLHREKESRPTLVVPDDFRTIQAAVDTASPGSTVVVKPGRYSGGVTVETSDLVIRGVDRFRTVLHGRDKRTNGITFSDVRNVEVRNLTVRNFTGNGIFFNAVRGYSVARVDSIKNRTYGIYAYDSYNGVIERSFGWGSGDAAFYVGQCMGCSAVIDRVHAAKSYIGYSGTNATGVVIRNSTFVRNGAGVVPNTLPTERLGPNRGTLVIDNVIKANNYSTVPPAGVSETFGIPFGTGVWLLGVENNVVKRNVIKDHDRYGVLITQTIDAAVSLNNRVRRNLVRDSGMYDLAWDGIGANNCFDRNDIEGATGPPAIQTLYACANRPFAGVPYPPVAADVARAAVQGRPELRESKEPPEPRRPRCQRGRPGCRR